VPERRLGAIRVHAEQVGSALARNQGKRSKHPRISGTVESLAFEELHEVGGAEMAKRKQLTIAVENRPGAVAEIAKVLGNAEVNVLSLTPYGGLVLGPDGNFYGTTTSGPSGSHIDCTIFKITPAGVLTTLHIFTGALPDGAGPLTSPTLGNNGNFYGLTGVADGTSTGIAYEYTPTSGYKILTSLTNALPARTDLVILAASISRATRLRAFTCRPAFHRGSTAVGSRTVSLCLVLTHERSTAVW
jgi:hypothetical protein